MSTSPKYCSMLPCENKTSHFILLQCILRTTPAASSMVWNIKFIKYRENKLIVTTYVQIVHLWLKHKLASVLAICQLYHQSATAPLFTTQLRDVHGLQLPVRRSSKPVSCTFLDNFLFLFVFSFYQNIPESVAKHRSLLIPISFKSKLCLLQYQFEIYTNNLLKFTWQWRHVYAMNKKVNSLFRECLFLFSDM